jgi:hypothetical protein
MAPNRQPPLGGDTGHLGAGDGLNRPNQGPASAHATARHDRVAGTLGTNLLEGFWLATYTDRCKCLGSTAGRCPPKPVSTEAGLPGAIKGGLGLSSNASRRNASFKLHSTLVVLGLG